MCPETKGRSLEDISAQFGEQVAIHYYGATEQEKAEFEAAAEGKTGNFTSQEKTVDVQQVQTVEKVA